jgi:6-phosphogluconolactonase
LQSFFKRKPKPTPVHPLVYIGTDTTRPGARGLYSARFDMETGQLSAPAFAAASVRPSFMAGNQVHGQHLMYVCNEGQDEHTSTISTHAVDMSSGALRLLGTTSAGGAGPCYIAVDATGHSAYVADYMGSAVASYQVMANGLLSAPVERLNFRNKAVFGATGAQLGPRKDRQDAPHPHSATLSPDNRFMVVNDLGQDLIAIFPIEAATGKLHPATVFRLLSGGSGPRHVTFHSNGRWVYGIDEIANRIDQYLWNANHADPGKVSQAVLTDAGHSMSTLAEGFAGKNTAAEIAVDPAGLFLYASNRGEDTLVVFAIDQDTGALSLVQRIGCGGKTPRHFTLDPSAKWLLCGNQDSANLTVFTRDGSTGKLSGPVQTVPIESPMYTLFL